MKQEQNSQIYSNDCYGRIFASARINAGLMPAAENIDTERRV